MIFEVNNKSDFDKKITFFSHEMIKTKLYLRAGQNKKINLNQQQYKIVVSYAGEKRHVIIEIIKYLISTIGNMNGREFFDLFTNVEITTNIDNNIILLLKNEMKFDINTSAISTITINKNISNIFTFLLCIPFFLFLIISIGSFLSTTHFYKSFNGWLFLVTSFIPLGFIIYLRKITSSK